jgi:ATP-dependent Lon protease
MKAYPTLITRDIVPIPHRAIKIEAGRDRSIAIAENHIRTHKNGKIVICTQIDSLVEVPKQKDIYKFGALCEIVNIEKYPSSTQTVYCIEVIPLKRVEIIELSTDKDYYEAKVETVKETMNSQLSSGKPLSELISLIGQLHKKKSVT